RVAVLSISIGTVVSGSRAVVDPNLVSNNVAPGASAFTFQRKVFYDTVGRNYWVFYYDGYYIRYRYSSDGTNWYVPSDTNGYLPGYWPGYQTSDMSLPPILNAGQTVVVATGESVYATNVPPNYSVLAHLYYIAGTISGHTISWPPSLYVAGTRPMYCSSNGPLCTITGGLRDVN